MAQTTRKRLGEILIEDGLLSQESLSEALCHQKKTGGLIGQILIQLGYVTEEELVGALGKQLRVPYMPLNQYAINAQAVQLLDEAFCRKNIILAFDCDDRHICLAIADPLHDVIVEEIRQMTKLKPQVFISTPTEIRALFDQLFEKERDTQHKKAG